MWISKLAWLSDRQEHLKVVAEKDAIASAYATQKATLEWLMLRMTQLEAERAKLLWKYMGVEVPQVQLEEAPVNDAAAAGTFFNNPMNRLPNFDDMGDHEARKQGIGWDKYGSLAFGKQDSETL